MYVCNNTEPRRTFLLVSGFNYTHTHIQYKFCVKQVFDLSYTTTTVQQQQQL